MPLTRAEKPKPGSEVPTTYTLRSISFNIHGRQPNATEEKAFAPEHRGRRPPATKMSPDFSWRDGESSRMITRTGKSLPGQGQGVVHPCEGFARAARGLLSLSGLT
jgi:hypothetical protein